MSAIAPGTDVTYHSEHGKVPATVIEYDEGHEAGDYRIGGFTNQAMRDAGAGDVFNIRAVFGTGQGTFSV